MKVRHASTPVALALLACGPEPTETVSTTGAQDASSDVTSGSGAEPVSDLPAPPPDLPPTAEPPPIAALIYRDIGVFLEVSFDGGAPALLRYDTGSPTTYVDVSVGLDDGVYEAAIGAVVVGERPVRAIDWIEADFAYPGLPGPVLGLVGNDFFEGYAVGLNYRDEELWLYSDDARALPDGTAADAVQSPMTPTEGYLLVPCRFQTEGADGPCLFDTGAIFSLVYEDHWSTLTPPDSHRVPLITFDNQGNELEGFMQRAQDVRMGGLSVPGDAVSVLSEFALLDSVGDLIGADLRGLVGMTSTLGHYTVIDYRNDELEFYAYDTLAHLPQSPFEGYGIVVGSVGASLHAARVVPGSQAENAGVQAGDALLDTDLEFTILALIAGEPGDTRTFALERNGAAYEVELIAEDLLPEL